MISNCNWFYWRAIFVGVLKEFDFILVPLQYRRTNVRVHFFNSHDGNFLTLVNFEVRTTDTLIFVHSPKTITLCLKKSLTGSLRTKDDVLVIVLWRHDAVNFRRWGQGFIHTKRLHGEPGRAIVGALSVSKRVVHSEHLRKRWYSPTYIDGTATDVEAQTWSEGCLDECAWTDLPSFWCVGAKMV